MIRKKTNSWLGILLVGWLGFAQADPLIIATEGLIRRSAILMSQEI
ncbi:hypothetical protein [Nitrincola sp. A-D6]|nr:hypothetical protein [Nitrincola sp. A-D6]